MLERAFASTYGLELKELFANLDLAIGTYRRAASVVIPELTRVAWETRKDEIEKATPGITREKFIYKITREDYEKRWGKQYDKPGMLHKTLSVFFRVLPKAGPFAPLSFKPLTAEVEQMFIDSFNTTLQDYRVSLNQVRTGRLNLPNKNFDTGEGTRAGEYELADEAYEDLLNRLAGKGFATVTPALRQNILSYYRDLKAPIATKKDKDDWQELLRSLERLKETPTQAASTASIGKAGPIKRRISSSAQPGNRR